MPTLGLTDAGFYAGTLEEHRATVELRFKNGLGQGIDTTDESPYGQLISELAQERLDLYQLAQAVYMARDPDSATGDALIKVCHLTGIDPLPATYSRATVTLTGTAGATIPAGTLFAVQQSLKQFELDEDVTLNGSGEGEGTATATATGPIQATAETLTLIVNPTADLDEVTNEADAELGTDIETPAALRARRLQALNSAGKGTPDAILADLVALADVAEAYVYNNPLKTTDGDGRPASSIEVVVLLAADGDAQAVADKLWEHYTGYEFYGSDTYTVYDSTAKAQTVKLTEATEKPVYMIATITRDPKEYPADGDAQVAAALLAAGLNNRNVGRDVVYVKLLGAASLIAGVNDLSLLIGFTDPPSGTTNLVIGAREVAEFSSDWITITPT